MRVGERKRGKRGGKEEGKKEGEEREQHKRKKESELWWEAERREWSNTIVVTDTQSCIHSCLCDVRTGSEVGERGARSQVFAETGLEHTLVFYAWRICLWREGRGMHCYKL